MISPHARSLLITSSRIAMAFGLLGLVFWLADGANAARQLASADPVYIALALLALTAQTVLCARRWRLTATRLGMEISQTAALGEYYLGQIVNQLVPGGVVGDAARAVRAKGSAGMMASGQSVVFERLTGQLALLVYLCAAMVATLIAPGGLTWPDWTLCLVLAIFGSGAVVVALVGFGKTALSARWVSTIRRQSAAFAHAVAAPDVRWSQISLSMLAAASNLAAFGLCAWAVGVDLPFLTLMAMAPVILMAMLVPFTVSGWGVREGAAAVIFPLAGASAADGLATSIIFGLVFLSSALPGVVWLGVQSKAKTFNS